MKIEFLVIGLPKGAGSKHGFAIKKDGQYTGKIAMVDTSGEAGKSWRASIVAAAFDAMRKANITPFSEPVILTACFIMPRPRSHYRAGRHSNELKSDASLVHFVRPDATKLVRQLEDSLTNVVWRDDAAVVEQHIYKFYGDQPGCRVKIESWDQIQSRWSRAVYNSISQGLTIA